MNRWIRDILNSPYRVAMPVMTHPGIEGIGCKVIDAVKNGDIHYKAIQYMADRFPSGCSTTIMDLTVEAEAFGSKIAFAENDLPNVIGRLVSDEESISRLKVPDLNVGRVQEYLKAARLTVANIKDRPVLAGCIGPYSLAGRLYDMSEIMVAIYTEPDSIIGLLEKCNEFIISYCKELKKTGVDGVFIAEPASGLLSDDDCMTYSTVFIQKLVAELQDDTFAVVLHNCGNSGQCTNAMVESGAAALHFGNAINMAGALKECPKDILVMGNVDPVNLLKYSTPECIENEIIELLNATREYPNFVLSTGCDLPPGVPVENIQSFFNALDRYNKNV